MPEYKNILKSETIVSKTLQHLAEPAVLRVLPKQSDLKNSYFKIIGLIASGQRASRFIKREYVSHSEQTQTWRVIIPKAFGKGSLGERIPEPTVVDPNTCFTETFLAVGGFTSEAEAKNLCKYLQTKFALIMLGLRKTTHNTTKSKFVCVPLQDFSNNSDIDWSKSIAEIDQQLYRKYKFNKADIKFIESQFKD